MRFGYDKILSEGEQSFEDFYYEYLRFVHAAVRSVLRSVDEGVVEDAVQDVMVKLWKSLFRGGEGKVLKNKKGFVWSTARNLALDVFRRNGSLQRFLSRFLVEPNGGHEPFPEELLTVILEVLPTLDERHQRVLQLYYVDGLSCVVIAERLNVSVGTVWSRLFAAKKALRRALGEDRVDL